MGLGFQRHIGQMSYPSAGAGGVTRLELPKTAIWRNIIVHLFGTVDQTTGGGTHLTESPHQLIRDISIVANGSNVLKSFDGPMLFRCNQFDFGVTLQGNLQSGTANADFEMNHGYILPFAMPRSVRPADTFLDAREWSLLELKITWGNQSDIISSATGTWDFSDVVAAVSVEELVDVEGNFALFTEQQLTTTFTSQTGRSTIRDLPTGDFYRALTIRNLVSSNPSDVGPLTITLRSGATRFIDEVGWGGEPAVALRGDLRQTNIAQYGIREADFPVGYRRIDFAKDGLLTEALNSRRLEELMLETDLASGTTATVAVATSTLVNPQVIRG